MSAANPTIPTHHTSNQDDHRAHNQHHQIAKTKRRVAVSAANPTTPAHLERHASNEIDRLVGRSRGVRHHWRWWGSLRAALLVGFAALTATLRKSTLRVFHRIGGCKTRLTRSLFYPPYGLLWDIPESMQKVGVWNLGHQRFTHDHLCKLTRPQVFGDQTMQILAC